MKEKKKEFPCMDNSQKNFNLYLYLVIFTLLICSRFFDMYTTYLATPNLTGESNIMVRYLGLGWFILIFMNLAIILIFFFLFRFSWSRFMKRYPNRRMQRNPSFQELNNDVNHHIANKQVRSQANHRNIPLEIGMTLPIYVIITGYFQGIVNMMIHLELIFFSFTGYLFLYPVIIGGIFGYISLYITKRFLYLGHPRFNKKAHKIMMPKRTVE